MNAGSALHLWFGMAMGNTFLGKRFEDSFPFPKHLFPPVPSFSVGVCTFRGLRDLEAPSQFFTSKAFLWGINLFLKS